MIAAGVPRRRRCRGGDPDGESDAARELGWGEGESRERRARRNGSSRRSGCECTFCVGFDVRERYARGSICDDPDFRRHAQAVRWEFVVLKNTGCGDEPTIRGKTRHRENSLVAVRAGRRRRRAHERGRGLALPSSSSRADRRRTARSRGTTGRSRAAAPSRG